MADGDLLTLDSAQPGGEGELAGEEKWSWKPPATPAITLPGAPGTGRFIAGLWYPPGPAISVSGGKLNYGTPTSGVLWAVPTAFPVAGTITDLAVYSSGNGGGTTKVYVAIYRDNAGVPGARVFSGEATAANFTHAKIEFNGVGVAVSKGELLWFAAVTNGPQCLGLVTASLFPLLGLNFDGTGGNDPLRTAQVGYRRTFAYAQPPDPWGATVTKLLATDDAGAGVATPLFKFTPS